MTEFCFFLKSMRSHAGLTIDFLARETGLSPSTLRRWEEGRFQPRLVELHRLLQALHASPEQTTQVIGLLQAPRAQRHLRNASSLPESRSEDLNVLPSGAGDLWRALRMRRGWTCRQVAAQLKVSPSTITRWEQSQVVPPRSQFEALCTVLHAHPKEREALWKARLFLASPLTPEKATLETCETRIEDLIQAMERGDCVMGDLEFLLLEAGLWMSALRHAGAMRLLALTYVWHAEWLLRRGRWQEMNAYAHRALELAPTAGKPESYWLRAEGMCAIYVAHGPTRRQPLQGMELRRSWLDVATHLGDETGSYRDMAGYAAESGQFEEALRLITQAHKAAERFADPDPLKLSRFIHARILLAAGKSCEAVEYLPQQEDIRPTQRVSDQVIWAQTMMAIGEKEEAHRWLARFYSTIKTFDLEHRKEEGDRLALLL